jgi:leucyl-tRNA synthetase
MQVVEVPEGTPIAIPRVAGAARVDQIRHYLEIQRMSKSKGNVVNPDELVNEYGADTVRAYLMFAFDWIKGGPWDPGGVKGVIGWLNHVWDMVVAGAPAGDGSADVAITRKLHQTIHRVEDSFERFSFNTAISALMELRNDLRGALRDEALSAQAWEATVDAMLRLMAPIVPHITEELWARLGRPFSIHQQPWPVYDAEVAAEDTVTLVVMINGKPRDRVDVPAGIGQAEAEAAALATEGAQRALNGGSPRKVIFIAAHKGQEPKVNIVV